MLRRGSSLQKNYRKKILLEGWVGTEVIFLFSVHWRINPNKFYQVRNYFLLSPFAWGEWIAQIAYKIIFFLTWFKSLGTPLNFMDFKQIFFPALCKGPLILLKGYKNNWGARGLNSSNLAFAH